MYILEQGLFTIILSSLHTTNILVSRCRVPDHNSGPREPTKDQKVRSLADPQVTLIQIATPNTQRFVGLATFLP
jgi:hypothetical protein